MKWDCFSGSSMGEGGGGTCGMGLLKEGPLPEVSVPQEHRISAPELAGAGLSEQMMEMG